MLKEQIELIKAEYYQAEMNHKQQLSDYKINNEILQEKLANYEDIEREIDEALQFSEGHDENSSKYKNIYIQAMEEITSDDQLKKVKKALCLSQKLREK